VKEPKHPRLTPMRALVLIDVFTDNPEDWNRGHHARRQIREALQNHVKAELVKRKRRSP
jgi:hypothetical protein